MQINHSQVYRIFTPYGRYVDFVLAVNEQDALQHATKQYGRGCMVQLSSPVLREQFLQQIRKQDRKQETEYFRMRDAEKAESQGFRTGVSSKNWTR